MEEGKINTENNQRRGSGSVCVWASRIGIRIRYQRYGYEDPDTHPDPYQNVTEPQHWFPRRSATVREVTNSVSDPDSIRSGDPYPDPDAEGPK
jgi:hypothetical protein